MSIVLIAGGSGLVGRRLRYWLEKAGHSTRILTRKARSQGQYQWDPARGVVDPAALEGVDAVVNLAGAGIADARWTSTRKRELVDSRVQSAQTLIEAMGRSATRPAVYISASAIGLYGDTGEALITEEAPAGQGFMPACCEAWEQAAGRAERDLGVRTVLLRIGIVLALEGGALPEVLRPMRMGLGVSFADGKAWWSWIHVDDLCRIILWAMEQPAVAGPYHAVAPHPARNRDLVRAIGRARGRGYLPLSAPGWALRLMLGEMSAVVLNSNRISAQKLQDAGFDFAYPQLEEALTDLLGRGPTSA